MKNTECEFAEYLRWHVMYPSYIFLKRNFALEQNIALGAKLEYMLQNDSTLLEKVFKDEQFLLVEEGSMKYFSLANKKCMEKTVLEYEGLPVKFENKCEVAHLLSHCVESNAMIYRSAINHLQSALDIKEPYRNINDSFIEQIVCSKIIEPWWGNEYNKIIRFHIFHTKDSRILVPVFFDDNERGFHFYPEETQQDLINSDLNYEGAQNIIITDCVELAVENQKIQSRLENNNCVFLSWYGGADAISRVKWLDLEGYKNIYYLLVTHSGEDIKQAYETAKLVRKQLAMPFGASDIKLIWYGNDCCKHDSLPYISTFEEYESIQTYKSFAPVQSYSLKSGHNSDSYRRQLLMSPVIYDNTCTVIYGAQDIGKTLFALNIAVGLALGKRAFEGWICGRSATKVLYLYGKKTHKAGLSEQLGKIRAVYSGRGHRQKQGPVEFDQIQRIGCSSLGQDTKSEKVLFWNQIDASDIKSNADFIRRNISEFEYSRENKLLVLDELITPFPADEIFPAGDYLVDEQSCLLKELKERGWTIIVVFSWLWPDNGLAPDIEFDSLIRLKKMKTNSINKLRLAVNVNTKKKRLLASQKNFDCEFNFSGKYPRFSRIIKKSNRSKTLDKVSREKLKEKVRMHFVNGAKIKEVVKDLNITEPFVKKLKRELGLSKKRQQKIVPSPNIIVRD
jgi:hypothetical protein